MEDFEVVRCCQAVEEGDEITLQNVERGEAGRLLFCSSEGLQVLVDGHREIWPAERCEAIGTVTESPHSNL